MEGVKSFVLNNGVEIPSVGFGTWQIPNGEIAYNAVSHALNSGYKHIDTARTYGNEHSVGRAIKDSGISRSDIFVTSKLPADCKNYSETFKSFDKTLQTLDLDYLDLYLIHAPWPWAKRGFDYSKENAEVWRAMEEIYRSGQCRAIGVSNFEVCDLKAILENCAIAPMANQILFYVGNNQEKLTQYCQEKNILIEGYSPLATGAILGNRKLGKIAEKYKSTIPQISIRYLLQKQVLPLPKSINPEHIKSNLDLDFEITVQDMEYLDKLTGIVKGMRISKIRSNIKKRILALLRL